MAKISGDSKKGFFVMLYTVDGKPLCGFVYDPIKGWARGVTNTEADFSLLYPYK